MKLAVLTTGGDAPGMNAAIRAVVRRSLAFGWETFGCERGYQGLFEDDFRPMDHGSVSGIINHGGTVLKTLRCPDFKEPDFRRQCYKNLEKRGIENLVVIGGDGSLAGARCICRETVLSLAFIPASIDNDIAGTEETVGFDTAVNTALDAIDKIRDTATSHERVFLVEVMGREKGFLALAVGLAAGAEVTLVPEVPFRVEEVVADLNEGREKGKRSMIVVVAEGAAEVPVLANQIEKGYKGEVRYSILGYVQRGGVPTARSRNLAFLFGARAVEALKEGNKAVFVGIEANRVVTRNLLELPEKKALDLEILNLAHLLAS